MGQEAPADEDLEDLETTEEAVAEFSDSIRALNKVLDTGALQAISKASAGELSQIAAVTDQIEGIQSAVNALEEAEIEEFDQAIDPEVVEAITRTNNTQESTEQTELVREPEDVAETIADLYDEDRLAAIRELLEEHNLRIVQQLLASETGALSPKEVAFRNRGVISESTVRDHLRTLTDHGFVEKLEPDVDTIPNEMPRTFYAASPLAIELLKQIGLWDNLGMLYQLYSSLERPADIQRIEEWEHRPTPEWI